MSHSRTLESIRTNLISGSYVSLTHWHKDIISFWGAAKNACTDPLTFRMASEMSNWVAKQQEKIGPAMTNQLEWSNCLVQAYEDCVNVMTSGELPSDLSEFADRLSVSPNEPLYLPFSEEECEALAKAIQGTPSEDIARGITAIIRALEPQEKMDGRSWSDRSGGVVVQLDKCSAQTLHTIRDYVQEKLRKAGIEYPTLE
jgi:hypothetical protein